jgi:hypothetical protein
MFYKAETMLTGENSSEDMTQMTVNNVCISEALVALWVSEFQNGWDTV